MDVSVECSIAFNMLFGYLLPALMIFRREAALEAARIGTDAVDTALHGLSEPANLASGSWGTALATLAASMHLPSTSAQALASRLDAASCPVTRAAVDSALGQGCLSAQGMTLFILRGGDTAPAPWPAAAFVHAVHPVDHWLVDDLPPGEHSTKAVLLDGALCEDDAATTEAQLPGLRTAGVTLLLSTGAIPLPLQEAAASVGVLALPDCACVLPLADMAGVLPSFSGDADLAESCVGVRCCVSRVNAGLLRTDVHGLRGYVSEDGEYATSVTVAAAGLSRLTQSKLAARASAGGSAHLTARGEGVALRQAVQRQDQRADGSLVRRGDAAAESPELLRYAAKQRRLQADVHSVFLSFQLCETCESSQPTIASGLLSRACQAPPLAATVSAVASTSCDLAAQGWWEGCAAIRCALESGTVENGASMTAAAAALRTAARVTARSPRVSALLQVAGEELQAAQQRWTVNAGCMSPETSTSQVPTLARAHSISQALHTAAAFLAQQQVSTPAG